MSASDERRESTAEAGGRQPRRPGHELGAARDRADISLEEMASRLHLTEEQVEAIERDDYQHLPPAAFVRGYLRAYAKQVGLDADTLVEEFDAIAEGAGEPDLVVSHGVPEESHRRGPLMAILTLAVIALIAAAAWWAQQNSLLSPPAMEPPATEDTATTTLDEPAAGDAAVGDAETEAEPDAATEAVGEVAEEAVEAPDTTAADTAGSAADDGSAAAGDAETAATGTGGGAADPEPEAVADDATGQAEVEPETAPETPAVAAVETDTVDDGATAGAAQPEGPLATSSAELAATSAAASGPDRLEIVVEGESWLEVYDDRGRRLVYTLYSGDNPVVLNGWAPFDVFLGNSPAVTVRFGETTIDQSPFVRSDNTARFLADSGGARRR